MKAVGVRELKNRLSEYLRQVRGGEQILVTDRGEVIAELRQPGRSELDTPYPELMRYVQRGKARMGGPNDPELYPSLTSVLPPGRSLTLLDQERGER